jgi:AcrR family transcriptional regulator
MPRISAARFEDRYEGILAAARDVFEQSGYEAAAISDIARRANVSDGLIYHYFENKRGLFDRVLGQFYEKIIFELEAAIDRSAPFVDQLRSLVGSHLNVFQRHSAMCRLFIASVRTSADYAGSDAQGFNRRYTSVFLRIFETGVKQGFVRDDIDARLVRDLIFGGLEHLAWRQANGGAPMDIDAVAVSLADLLFNGLRPRTA